jgi:hypothetical protein
MALLYCDILAQGFNKINRIPISSRYIFFSKNLIVKSFRVKYVWSEIISG